jgi:hypothetical protein
MSGSWPWAVLVVAVLLGLAILTAARRLDGCVEIAALVVDREERGVRLALLAVLLAMGLSFAGCVYPGARISDILVTRDDWGTAPRCFWSGGQLVRCSSPAERDAALRDEAIRRGYLEPSP